MTQNGNWSIFRIVKLSEISLEVENCVLYIVNF